MRRLSVSYRPAGPQPRVTDKLVGGIVVVALIIGLIVLLALLGLLTLMIGLGVEATHGVPALLVAAVLLGLIVLGPLRGHVGDGGGGDVGDFDGGGGDSG